MNEFRVGDVVVAKTELYLPEDFIFVEKGSVCVVIVPDRRIPRVMFTTGRSCHVASNNLEVKYSCP